MQNKYTLNLLQDIIHIRPKQIPLRVCLPMKHKQYKRLEQALARNIRPTSPRLPQEIPTAAVAAGTYHHHLEILEITTDYSWQPKSHHQGRDVPIPARLRPVIVRLVSTTMRDRYVADPLVAKRSKLGLADSSLLFPGREGGLLRHNLNDLIHEAARRGGIPAPRLHDLRHSYATWLRKEGVELPTIQKLLGHQDLKTTLVYADYTMEEGKRAVSRLTW